MQVDNVKSNRALRNISYADFKAYVQLNSKRFSLESQERLEKTFNVCDQLENEHDRKVRLYNVLYHKCLWDIDEAKEVGFVLFLEDELKDVVEMFSYYRNNDINYIDEINNKYRGMKNEREESRLC